jgi:hypothetical protein
MVGVTMDNRKATSAYTEAFRRLKRMTGFDHRRVLRAEAGAILKTWAGRTKVATQASVQRRAIARALYSITNRGRAAAAAGYMTINSGTRGGETGRMWRRTNRGKFQQAGHMNFPSGDYRWAWVHFPNIDWPEMQSGAAKAQERLRKLVPAAKRSIGLARQSVLQIADSLGIDLLRVPGGGVSAAGIAKARAALASNGRRYRNGTGRQGGSEVKAYVDLFNFLPYNQAIGMDRALLGVMAGRAKFIEKSYEKGVFDTERGILKAFPGLFTHYATAA